MHEQYQPREIEAAAQSHWDSQKSFEVSEQPGKDTFYCLSMFPYPSGSCTWATCATTPSAT